MSVSQKTENRHFLHQWLIHATVLLALGSFIAYTQFEEYRRIDSQERERLTIQAEIVEKNLAPQLALAGRVIDGVLRRPAGAAEDGAQLRLINEVLIGIGPIQLVDADGRVRASSAPGQVGADLAASAHFRAAAARPEPALLRLSAPPGGRSIRLYRSVAGPRGEFAGMVVASLRPEYVAALLDSVRYAPDVWASIADGAGRPLLFSPPAAGAGGGPRLAAQRTLLAAGPRGGELLRIGVSRDLDVLFAPWRKALYVQSLLFGAISVFSTLGLLLIQRRRRAQSAERKKAEEQIQQLAFFDQLTHLPNRILLLDRLKQAMRAGLRSGRHGAILFIDLDNFKTLNDTLGHDMGDLLLRQVAQRLNACVRGGDTVARLGGDEFVVMLTGLDGAAAEAARQVEAVGNKILHELSQTYRLKQLSHRSTSSIGATLFLGGQSSIDDLLKQADLAMYKSKAVGRNALRFFDPAMEVSMRERAALETDLRDAVPGRQFLLHYQPQVDQHGRLTGVEALLRWRHPLRGLVPPAEFIPLAEEIGVILPLGRWVLQTACRQLLAWEGRAETRRLSIAVNVSVRQFSQHDFVAQVLEALASSGADPRRLKLELTESLLVADVGDVVAKMAALKARGVGFALDDFGTGYSSLAYLKRLPLDQLKIDRSFVRDVLKDQSDASIAQTIIALARSLKLDVIAEGVETREQRDFLARAGCHAYQGYFFSRPLAPAELERYVRRGGYAAAAPALSAAS